MQADSTLLTNIVSVDPIYAYFNVDERSVLKYQQQVREGKLADARCGAVPIYLQLENEKGFPHQGSIDFVNNQFNSSTGTLQVRGLFPNANGFLIPGAFVRIRVAGSPLHPALLVTDRAVGTDQGQKYVLVVGTDNVVAVKPVELGPEVDGLRVVRNGLKGDEQVIINGIVNARPGSKVSPQAGRYEPVCDESAPVADHHEDGTGGRRKRESRQEISRRTRKGRRQVKAVSQINRNLAVAVKRRKRI